MSGVEKLPIGIEPRWMHDSRRVEDNLDAIDRYTDANMPIPKKWIEELKDIFEAYCNGKERK